MTTDINEHPAATGWILFAAAVMFTIGAVDIIQGIVALTKSGTYVIPGGENSLLVTTDFTTWGWALIIWGIVLILAAASLFAGRRLGAVVRNLGDHHQRHRPARLVPDLSAVEPDCDRTRGGGALGPDGWLEGRAGRAQGLTQARSRYGGRRRRQAASAPCREPCDRNAVCGGSPAARRRMAPRALASVVPSRAARLCFTSRRRPQELDGRFASCCPSPRADEVVEAASGGWAPAARPGMRGPACVREFG